MWTFWNFHSNFAQRMNQNHFVGNLISLLTLSRTIPRSRNVTMSWFRDLWGVYNLHFPQPNKEKHGLQMSQYEDVNHHSNRRQRKNVQDKCTENEWKWKVGNREKLYSEPKSLKSPVQIPEALMVEKVDANVKSISRMQMGSSSSPWKWLFFNNQRTKWLLFNQRIMLSFLSVVVVVVHWLGLLGGLRHSTPLRRSQ